MSGEQGSVQWVLDNAVNMQKKLAIGWWSEKAASISTKKG